MGLLRVSYLSTSRPVAALIARLLAPEPGMSVYDPCCGSGRLLFALHRQAGGGAAIGLWGQEIDPLALRLARLGARRHRAQAHLAGGDAMRAPAFAGGDGRLERFDLVAANPMWMQPFPTGLAESDTHGRFSFGAPPAESADWAWVQHGLASLADGGRMAIILDREAASRPGPRGAEAAIRRRLVEADLVEAVITCVPRERARSAALGGLLADSALLILNRAKRRPGEVMLIEAGPLADALLAGRLSAAQVADAVVDAYAGGRARDGLAAVAGLDELAGCGFDLTPGPLVRVGA